MASDSLPLSKIDLNQADVKTLSTLPNIGPKLAERIIRFREDVQPFEEAVELTAVSGISERMYRLIANQVTVSASEALDIVPSPTPQPIKTIHKDDEPQPIVESSSDKPPPPQTSGISVSSDVTVPKEVDEGYIIMTDDTETSEVNQQQPDTDKPIETEGYYIIQTDETDNEQPVKADERSNFWRPWVLMIVGALLGTCGALSLIFWLNNGTLYFDPQIKTLENQIIELQTQEKNLNEEIKALQKQLAQYESLSARLQNTEAEIKILKQARDVLTEQVTTLENESSEIKIRLAALEGQTTILDEQVSTLEETSGQMQDDINELQLNTSRFDDFLTRLRDLLLAVQGSPDTTLASPTPTKAPSTSTPTPSPTLTPTATTTPSS